MLKKPDVERILRRAGFYFKRVANHGDFWFHASGSHVLIPRSIGRHGDSFADRNFRQRLKATLKRLGQSDAFEAA